MHKYLVLQYVKCSQCKGTGQTAVKHTCAYCAGTGEVKIECQLSEALQAVLPAMLDKLGYQRREEL